MLKRNLLLILGILAISRNSYTQGKSVNDTIPNLTLEECIAYAYQHQPALMQSFIGISIARKTNSINLSGWLPQAYLNGNLTHYIQLPTAFEINPENPEGPLLPVKSGISNTATPQLSATQTIFSPAVFYAANSAHLYIQQANQACDSAKIGIVVSVSKSFYNLLLTLEQIKVLQEDTARLTKNLKDAYHQYIGGIADKTDYKEAIVSLNNSRIQLEQQKENILPQYAVLKQSMGFPPEKNFNVSIDTAFMMREIVFDTTQPLKYENRIEYQLLKTSQNIQQKLIGYYRYSFLPSLSAFYDYNYEFENNSFSDLFNKAYPYSYIGASISIPLFTGFSRLESLEKAKLQAQQLDWNLVALKSRVYSDYTSALANYKSNLFGYFLLKENVSVSKDVYNVVSLQYRQGIVPYLNVITAESDLISSEISYYANLFQVLQSKIDLEKAMGIVSINH